MSDWYQGMHRRDRTLPLKLKGKMYQSTFGPVVVNSWLWWIFYQCPYLFFVSMESKSETLHFSENSCENTVEKTASVSLNSAFILALSQNTHNVSLCIIWSWALLFSYNTISKFCTYSCSKEKTMLWLNFQILSPFATIFSASGQFVFVTKFKGIISTSSLYVVQYYL